MTMTTMSRPETTVPVSTNHRTRWITLISVVLLVVGVAAGFFVGRATKADPPADLASASAVAVLNDYAAVFNSGDAKAIAELFTEDAVSVGPDEEVGAMVVMGQQRIGEALASLRDILGMRITNPGTAIQRGSWVSQPVEILGENGFMVMHLVDGKIAYQMVMFENPMDS